MAAPSLTYTLTNGSTADASQVMQNFNDLLNGITDGTKDLSISALTCAGTATLNGHVTLGNSSADDLTVTASVASNVVPKTDATYALGSSSIGFSGIYLGRNSQRVRILPSASASASWDFILPVNDGTANQHLLTDGSGVTSWQSLAVGTSGTDFAINHAAGTTTLNLPDASGTARGAVTTGAQTIAGAKVFTSLLSVNPAAGDAEFSLIPSSGNHWRFIANSSSSLSFYNVSDTLEYGSVSGSGAWTLGNTGSTQTHTVNGHTSLDGFLRLSSGAVTISGGAITATKTNTTVDTEASAGSDDLDTISGGTTGDLIILRASSGARTVVVKNGTGNISLAGSDFSLNNNLDTIVLLKTAGNWAELCRSDNGT